MITRLLAGILACVFVPLGIVFTALEPSAGLPFLALGALFAAAFGVLSQRAGAARRRRRDGLRAPARVVHARLHAGVRVGVLLTYDLTVTFPAAPGEVTQRVLVAPNVTLTPGEEILVAYDPADPTNFEPAASIDQGAAR